MKERKSCFAQLLFLVPVFMAVFMCLTTMEVYAKEVHMERGEEVYYEKFSTFYYYIDGKLSYCLEPSKSSPHTGDFTAERLDKNQLLSKALYYVYGAPGYEQYMKARFPAEWRGEAEAYCLSHCILAYVYDNCNENSDAFKGLSEQTKQTVRECVGYIRSFPDPVEPQISFSKTSLNAYFDEEEKVQRTEDILCTGDSRNYIEMQLPEGIVLVNKTKGTKTQNQGKVWGNDTFYLCADVALYNGEKYSSTDLYGAVQKGWDTYVISTGAEGQHLGMGYLETGKSIPVSLQVTWLPKPELTVDKLADKTGKEYRLGDIITYTMDVTQQIEKAVAKNVVITDTILTDGVKLQKNSIVLLDENQSIISDAIIKVKGNSFTIKAGEFLKGIETGQKYTVEYQVAITDVSVIGKEVENQVIVRADNTEENEDREKVTVKEEPEEVEEEPEEEPEEVAPDIPEEQEAPVAVKAATVKTGDEQNTMPLTVLWILSCVAIITCVTMNAWRRAKDR